MTIKVLTIYVNITYNYNTLGALHNTNHATKQSIKQEIKHDCESKVTTSIIQK